MLTLEGTIVNSKNLSILFLFQRKKLTEFSALKKKTHDNNNGLQKLSLRVSYRTIIYMHWHSKSRCVSIYTIYIYVCVCVHIYTDIHVHTCMCNVMFLSSSPRQKCSELQKR